MMENNAAPEAGRAEPPAVYRSDELGMMIRAKYPGPAWVVLGEVRDGVGFNTAGRSADAMAFGVWPSRGLRIVGFESKSHRNDWLRELKRPEKAESIARFCDEWWLVSGPGVARLDEIPPAWGWYEAGKRGLSAMKQPQAPAPAVLDRTFLMSIIRNLSRSYVPRSDVEAAVSAKLEDAIEAERDRKSYRLENLVKMEKRVDEFMKASGIDITSEWRFPVADVGKVVRMVLDGNLPGEAERVARAARLAEECLKAVAELRFFKGAKPGGGE